MKQLIDYIKRDVVLSDADVALLQQQVEIRDYEAHSMIFESGKVSHDIYFVLEGFVRMFYWTNGTDKTAFFYPEGAFICAGKSYTQQVPALENFQAIETTKLVVLNRTRVEYLISKIPQLEIIARLAAENELMMMQDLVSSFVTKSAEERYMELLKNNKMLLQRVPQRYIASFLGVSPETLSRIKRRTYLKPIS
ncbi:Crp/Fnr family transcriptional regulator [Sphingobacterium sp. N143]|uniref:Crp/Fnr family transcriptional regulator n=1 Tax=Sphingobacterium sp. N143 TaxID=2746727 RepID=UPI00257686F3|nr:Crp/Fnr family transcriptional regulator [Sphingobacterium sp. N143]MDM1292680.1 Crp/Fnr family transcriptional regulator [Sphingobacterium sp. N143]